MDGNAAWRLGNYYEFYIFNDAEALKWMSIAATNGNQEGMDHLGWYFGNKPNRDSTDVKNAKFWLGKLAAQGDTNAMDRMRSLP